jgi:hypothetical protein
VKAFYRSFLLVLFGAILSCCAVVDQFEERIYTSNVKSQNALNQETLVNIVRASRFQTMNFVALTQVTGGQSETLTTGLPTITFGPLQTAAQHQFPFTNSLSSGAIGGFQTNPLVSTTFQSAMLSPVSPRVVALLASSHPREPVFFSLVHAIILSNGPYIVRFENDPSRPYNDDVCAKLKSQLSKAVLQDLESGCNYPTFTYFLWKLIDAGISSELLPIENVAQKDAPQAQGHFCFDRSRALVGYDALPICGVASGPKVVASKAKKKEGPPIEAKKEAPAAAGGMKKEASATVGTKKPAAAVQAPSARLEITGVGTFDLDFSLRSPVAVFRFLGALYENSGGIYRYRTQSLKNLLGPDEPFVNIISGNVQSCYTSVYYDGQQFCVPAYSANTALLFTILQELRNLSIQSTDLNSAFTVSAVLRPRP